MRAVEATTDRNAIAANIQWQPDNEFDINLDLQYSFRRDDEIRHNFVIAEGRRAPVPIEIADDFGLLAFNGNSRIELQSSDRRRDETYLGAGANVSWQRDNLKLTADVGYSRAERTQDDINARLRTDGRLDFLFDARGFDVPNIELTDTSAIETLDGSDFDINSLESFGGLARALDANTLTEDEVINARLDGVYIFDESRFTCLLSTFDTA